MSQESIRQMIDQYKDFKVTDQTKLREILQQTALLGLERHGFFEKAAFYGGTALRILYGLDRFSEDLDFTLLTSQPNFEFKPYLEGLRKELASFGFEMDVSQKIKNVDTTIVSAFMKINTIKLFLSIGDDKHFKTLNHNQKIQIKLEVDTDPPLGFRVENKLIINPTSFYALTLNKNDLFAGKMHAILYRAWKGRVKGRDWYDLVWYVKNSIPLNLKYLEACMRQAGNLEQHNLLDREQLLEMLRSKIDTVDWSSAQEDMRPFIPDPERLNIWSPQYFNEIIDKIKIE